DLYFGFTGKKLLSYPPGAGSTALGLSIDNEVLRSQSEQLLRAISYAGIIDIDWRQDERDGQYKIMDCNPRLGVNFRMFESIGAVDVVRAQHLDLSGRLIDRSPSSEGRLFIVEPWYLLSIVRGGRTERDGCRLGVIKELAWWSTDDRIPFLLMS